jgi:hypothetical protein
LLFCLLAFPSLYATNVPLLRLRDFIASSRANFTLLVVAAVVVVVAVIAVIAAVAVDIAVVVRQC